MAKSAAIRLLDLVWQNTTKDTSYERLNHSMRDALTLAIGCGMPMAAGDIKHVFSNYRSGYWISDSDEWIYTLAIQVGNMPAIKSYEAAKDRKPFLADDVSFSADSGYIHSSYVNRQRERLCVGCSFSWKGLTLKVNSFAKDQSAVNACSYRRVKEEGHTYATDKVDKRFKITRDDILTERAERKERAELMAKLIKASESKDNSAAIIKALGVKSNADYARLSIEKIRKVAQKFEAA
jgi:hypothetical protein